MTAFRNGAIAALTALTAATLLPAAPAHAQEACAAAAPAKKKGAGGFGKLMAAAQRAGVADVIAANLGDGRGSQIAGVFAGAASGGGQVDSQAFLSGALAGASNGARAAQIAGAASAVARELGTGGTAASGPAPSIPCAPAQLPAARPAATWN